MTIAAEHDEYTSHVLDYLRRRLAVNPDEVTQLEQAMRDMDGGRETSIHDRAVVMRLARVGLGVVARVLEVEP